LDASRTAIANDDLKTVGQLSRLNSLALGTTAIEDSAISHLGNLSHLKSLGLAETGVTSAALVSIAHLKSLMILDLSGTKVKSELHQLVHLPRLEWLVLRNLDLDQNALTALAKCPTLHRLSLEESSYGKASLDTLLSSAASLVVDK
jgi:Leucine-rich repeat (LRR) protein